MLENENTPRKTGFCRKWLAILLFGLIFLIVSSKSTVYAAESADVTLKVQYKQTEARSMLDMVNEFRTGDDAWYWNSSNTTKIVQTNLKELTYDYNLEAIAMQRAAEIAVSFSHTRPDGSSCFTCKVNGTTSYAENIAAGSLPYASLAFNGWQESNAGYSGQGHRRAMLSSSYTSVGIACVCVGGSYYWVQEFSTRNSGAAKTSANNSYKDVDLTISTSEITPVSIAVSSDSVTSVNVGQKISVPSVTVKVNPVFGSTLSLNADCTWKAASNNYLSISKTGKKITGNHAGSKKIQTTVLGQKVTATIKVNLSKNSTFTTDGLKYQVTKLSGKTGTVTVTGAKNTDSKSLVIPATVKEGNVTLTVNKIGSGAFSKMKNLQSVSIGSKVKTIGKNAFKGCTALKEAGGAKGVKTIKADAFYNCKKLQTFGSTSGRVKLTSVEAIGDRAFAKCSSITTLRISSSDLKSIGLKAFWGCSRLETSAITSTKLSSIGEKAFYGCGKLRRFRISTKKLTKSSVGKNAFGGTASGCVYTVPSSKAEDYRAILKARGAIKFTIKKA